MKDYETLLNIKSSKQQLTFNPNSHLHRYEATHYEDLEQLLIHHPFSEHDHIVDFGCGKGRLNFFIHHHCQSYVTGVEMDADLIQDALVNKQTYSQTHSINLNKIDFLQCMAQEYNIKPHDQYFYFFNPFSVQIFMKVIENILASVETHPRPIEIILYYPLDDYIFYLESTYLFELKQEILLPKFERDNRERFVIYQLSYLQ